MHYFELLGIQIRVKQRGTKRIYILAWTTKMKYLSNWKLCMITTLLQLILLYHMSGPKLPYIYDE